MDPLKPFRPDLPAGPYTYFGLFLSRSDSANAFCPGDDAQVLIRVPLVHWGRLSVGVTLRTIVDYGGEVITKEAIDLSARVWLPPEESLVSVAPLLGNHPELERLMSLTTR
jgi:hypothetical protein